MAWAEYPTDELVSENMVMFYDEVRDALHRASTSKRALQALSGQSLPAD